MSYSRKRGKDAEKNIIGILKHHSFPNTLVGDATTEPPIMSWLPARNFEHPCSKLNDELCFCMFILRVAWLVQEKN